MTQIQLVGGQWNQEMRQAFADWPGVGVRVWGVEESLILSDSTIWLDKTAADDLPV